MHSHAGKNSDDTSLACDVVSDIASGTRALAELPISPPADLSAWKQLKLQGGGPYAVITDLCTMKFDDQTGEMVVVSLHPGVTIEQVQENTPWKLQVAPSLESTPEPTEKELDTLRSLDPTKIYLG